MANYHKHWYGTLADYTAVATKDSNTLYHCSEGLIYRGSVLLATRRWGDLSGVPSTFAPSAHSHSFSSLTSKPTTLSGYGITDGVSKNYLAARAENLVINGNGFLGDNTTFSQFTFDGSEAYGSPGSFKRSTSSRITMNSDDMISVDANQTYRISIDAKTVTGASTYYFWLQPYDVDGLAIGATNHMYRANTLTTLAQELKNGDTVVHLTSSANWYNEGVADVNAHTRSFIFWNYTNSFGYTYPPETYSRFIYQNQWDPGAIVGNTITLKSPWTRGTYTAGHPVSNGSAGGNKYGPFVNTIIPTTWTRYVDIIGGIDYSGQNVSKMFPPGTSKVRPFFYVNYNNTPNETFWFTNLVVSNKLGVGEALRTGIFPYTGSALDIGSSTYKWREIHTNRLFCSYIGANRVPYQNSELGLYTSPIYVDGSKIGVNGSPVYGNFEVLTTLGDSSSGITIRPSSTGTSARSWINGSNTWILSRGTVISLSIKTNSYVGIGTDSPSQSLDVAGAGNFSTKVITGGYNYTAQTAGVGIGADGLNNGITFYNGTGTTGRIYRDGDVMYFNRGGDTSKGFYMSSIGAVTFNQAIETKGLLTATGNIATANINGAYIKVGSATISWDSANGALRIDKPVYSTSSLSAFGLGPGGASGGSSYARLDDWADYTGTNSEWVLSAGLGNDLNVRVTNLETSTPNVSWGTPASYYVPLSINGSTKNLSLNGHIHSQYLTGITSSQVTNALGFTPYNSTNPSGYTTNKGTVTSVGLSVPTGLSVSGSPVTVSGTLAIKFASGYAIPTTAKQGQWDTAYSNNHTHSNKSVLDGITSGLVTNWGSAYTFTSGFATNYPDLTAIEGLTGTAGFLKKTGANTWSLDTSTYLTGITKAQVEGVLTGAITTHTHDGRYYTETEIGNIFKGTVAISGYNKSDWDSAYAHAGIAGNPHGTTKAQIGLGNVLNVASYSKTESDGKYLPLAGGTLTGNVTAPTFIGALNGNASTATKLSSITTTFTGTYPVTVNVNGNIYSHAGITFTGSTGTLAANTFSGSLAGNATSATKLQTARTIAGVSFNGTANIAIPFANLSSKPTTISGYGITDAMSTNTAQNISGTKTLNPGILRHNVSAGEGTLSYSSPYDIANSPLSYYAWHDHFAFLRSHTLQDIQRSLDGTTWENSSIDITSLFAQKEQSNVNILTASEIGFRFTVKSNNHAYSLISWFVFGFNYTSVSSSIDILIESSGDNENWTYIHNHQVIGAKKTFNFPNVTLPNNSTYIRITFTKVTNQATGMANLNCIKALTSRKGNQGLGRENEQPVDWTPRGTLLPIYNDAELGSITKQWTNLFAKAVSCSGNVSATSFSGPLTGNASSATVLATARTINGVSFNGSANITITANTPYTLTRGGYLTGSNFNGSANTTWAVDATSANTASKVVARDGNGDFACRVVNASSGVYSLKVVTGGHNYATQTHGVGIGTDGSNSGVIFYNGTGATGRIYRESDVMRFIRGGLTYSGFDINADGSITVQGDMTTRTSLVVGSGNGTYVQIGSARLVYDQTNNAIKVVNANNSSCNLYATGSISAFGIGSSGGSGTSYTRLDDWGDYLDGLTNDYILSAELGHGLYTSVNSLNSFKSGTAWGGSASGYSYLSIDGTIKALSIHGHSHSFASLSSKPTTLSGYGITDAMPLSGGTFLKSTFQILELKRNAAAGASMTFSNTSKVLAKFGFDVAGSLVIGTGTSTDGVPDMFSINGSTKQITGYGDLVVSGSIETGTSDGAYLRTGNVRFLYDNSVVGIRLLKVSGGYAPFYASAVYANEVQLTSSRSMKKDIRPFKNGLDLIKSIDVVSYLYKQDADDDDRKIGFIADDTDSWLSGKSKTKYNIGNTVGALIKAVQELEKKNQELEKRLLSNTNNN